MDNSYTVLFGPESAAGSSWVDSFAYIRYHRKMGVAVLFNDNVAVFYPDTTVDMYKRLKRNKSKGKTIWREFYHLDYVIFDF